KRQSGKDPHALRAGDGTFDTGRIHGPAGHAFDPAGKDQSRRSGARRHLLPRRGSRSKLYGRLYALSSCRQWRSVPGIAAERIARGGHVHHRQHDPGRVLRSLSTASGIVTVVATLSPPVEVTKQRRRKAVLWNLSY